jgi:hypothetical protein
VKVDFSGGKGVAVFTAAIAAASHASLPLFMCRSGGVPLPSRPMVVITTALAPRFGSAGGRRHNAPTLS